MKHLFVVAVATGIFTGTSFRANAQTNVNLEKLATKSNTQAEPKFINNIEITPNSAAGDGDYYSNEDMEQSGGHLPMPKTEAVAVKTKRVVATAGGTSIEKCSALQFKYAMLMDVEVETLTNFSLLNFIEEWWGTHYRYGGTDKKGIDCSSFSGKLEQEVYNNSLPRTAREQYLVCDKVDMEELSEGDLVFFNTTGGVSHVGVYLGNNYFVHSSTSNGVTISSLTENYYSRKFVGGGRVAASTAKK
ncbi:MAG: C40 family peptidase [Bacteroidota bacterium]